MTSLRKSFLQLLAASSIAVLPLAATAQTTAPPAPDRQEEQAPAARGVIGIIPTITAEAVGEPARLVVSRVAPNSPAHHAGLIGGDRIVAIGGQPIEGRGIEEIANAIRGEPGTTVALTLERNGQSREVELTRVAPVRGERPGHHGSRR